MATYTYNDGDGVDVLDKTTPNGATEPVSILDDAIRQIKAFLKDPVKGFKYAITKIAEHETKLSALDGTITGISPASGTIVMYGGTNAPAGWLMCDGSAISRTGTYASLFTAIGITYGTGNGVSTFNIPNFNGRSPIGPDNGSNTSPGVAIGSKGGSPTHTLVIAEIPEHDHSPYVAKQGDSYTGGGGPSQIGRGQTQGPDNTSIISASKVGGNQPHNNLHPYLGVNFIIKI